MFNKVIEINSDAHFFPDLAEAWHCRSIAIALMKRNVKVRFKQTLLGPLWFVIQPILLSGVLSVFVGGLLGVPSDGIPYVLFAFVGTSVWTTFQRALNDASVSIVGAGTIISKVYFPRVLVPISSVLTAAIDFAPICVVILIMIFVVGVFPGWPFVTFPLFILLMLVLALAVGLWVTVLDAMIRDIRFFIPYGLQILFYACPIMYSASIVPERWKILYRLNPLVGILEGFRWSLIAGAPSPRAFEVIITSGFAVLLLAGGLAAFARLEQMAVDRI